MKRVDSPEIDTSQLTEVRGISERNQGVHVRAGDLQTTSPSSATLAYDMTATSNNNPTEKSGLPALSTVSEI